MPEYLRKYQLYHNFKGVLKLLAMLELPTLPYTSCIAALPRNN